MKNIMKKFLSVLVLLVFIVNTVQVSKANAKVADKLEIEKRPILSERMVNPLYKDLDIGNSSYKGSVYSTESNIFTNISDIANFIRKEMVNRVNYVTFEYTGEYYEGFYQDIFDLVFLENSTASSSEGDYLWWHFKEALFDGYYNGNNISFSIDIQYLTNYNQEQSVNAEVKKVLDSLNVYNASEYKKIRAVYDYIINNISYDYTYQNHSAYNAIIDKSVVCQGYASLLYKMLKELKIGVRVIAGIGNGGAHGWNIVKIGSKWYNVDSTWDAVTEDYSYFLKSDYDFPDHYRDYEYDTNEFYTKYPMSESSYDLNTTDFKGHWAEAQIIQAMEKGWVNTTDTFRPNDDITRAEFVKIVNKACGFTAKASSESFTDVSSSKWYYNEVLIALKEGYISSKNTTFRPDEPITREEVAAIVTTIKDNKDSNLDKLSKYTDANQVSTWAKSSVEGAIEASYMGAGSTKFRPKDNITRAEAIVTLTRVVK